MCVRGSVCVCVGGWMGMWGKQILGYKTCGHYSCKGIDWGKALPSVRGTLLKFVLGSTSVMAYLTDFELCMNQKNFEKIIRIR